MTLVETHKASALVLRHHLNPRPKSRLNMERVGMIPFILVILLIEK
jgi:hypothetical protein